jgi:glycosyltransferase involved in cell wall biosynthesis
LKIALVHNFSLSKKTGGAERTAFKILEYLSFSSFEVIYCTLGAKSKNVSSKVLSNGIRHYGFPARNPFQSRGRGLKKFFFHVFEIFNLLSFLDFWKLAKRENLRFIFFHNPKGFSFAIWVCAVLQRIPFCLVNHDYYNICINSCFFKKVNGSCKSQCASCKTFRFFPWLLHYFSDFVVFLSYNQKRIFNQRGWFLNKKSFVVPPAIDSADYKPKIGLARKVGFIGRLDSTKGVSDFLDLCKSLSSTDLTFYIQSFRSDPSLSYYKSRAENIKNLKWVNEENLTFLRKIDFLVAPTQWEEPFGRVFLESLSVGTPCIGYPRGAISEIMTKELSIFVPKTCEVSSLSERLLFFYQKENEYKIYSKLCIERYRVFKNFFSRGMNAVIARV